MLKKFITGILFTVIIALGLNFQVAFAKTQSDWSKVVNAVNAEVSVKTSYGQTVFGKLISANDNEIVVQIADKKELTNQSSTIQKSYIKKVWTAKLRFGKQRGLSTAIGAAVGGGIGLGVGFGLLAATGGSDSTNEILAGFTLIGAGAGTGIGFLLGRQSHQKKDLIYEN